MRTEQQQKNDIRASNILLIALGVSLILSTIDVLMLKTLPGMDADMPDMRSGLFGMILLIHLLEALLYYAIRIGKPWARVVLLILAVLTVMPFLNGEETLDDRWSLTRQVISSITDVWALVLLFMKPEPQPE